MNTTSEKLTYLSETKSQLKTAINYTGAGITNDTFRQYPRKLYNKYVDIIREGTDTLYSNMPKVETTGTDLTINNTVNTKMALDLKPSATSQATSILPDGYTQVDYIESDGSKFINTGYSLQSNQLEIKTKVYIPTLPVSEQDIASNQDNSTNRFVLGINQSYMFGYSRSGSSSDTNVVTANLTAPNIFEIQMNYDYANSIKSLTVNGVTTTATQNKAISPSNNAIRLLANADGGGTSFKGRLYYLSITDNGILVRNFIPCYRNSDNEVGMYDTINGVFYKNGNSNTSSFTYGAVATLPNPDYPQDIHTVSGNNSIEVVGKNLFDKNDITANTGLTSEGGTFSNNNYCISNYIKVDEDKQIVFYNDINTRTKRVCFYTSNSENSFINQSQISNSKTLSFTTPLTCQYIRIQVEQEDKDGTMLEYGTATSYLPYTSQTLPLNLGDIELCKIGDYEDYFYKDNDKWYLRKATGKVDLSNCSWVTTYNIGNGWKITGTESITNIKYASVNTELVKCFAEKYIEHTGSGMSRDSARNHISIDVTKVTCQVEDTLTPTGNFIYPLVIPTSTEITDTTLIGQLETICNQAISYQDQTNITQVNNDLPFIITASTIKNYDSTLQ